MSELVKALLPQTWRSSLGRFRRNLRRKPESSYGGDFISEVMTRIPGLTIRTIFDIGAYYGITALQFSDAFPSAAVYAFEPVFENFEALRTNLVGKPQIQKHQMAMGEAPGQCTMIVDLRHPSTCRINDSSRGDVRVVDMNSVDSFCTANGIASIDLMKIDVEGRELDVLHGAADLLANNAIHIIKLECAIDPDRHYHTQLLDVCSLLHPFGYRLFGFYDQCEDFENPTTPKLRRFDAAFISSSLDRSNT